MKHRPSHRALFEEKPSDRQWLDLCDRFGQPLVLNRTWDLSQIHEKRDYPVCTGEVVLVVTNPKDHVLFVRRNDPASDRWSLPMGRIRPREKVDVAAIREAWEEAGVTITVRVVPTVYKLRIRFKDWDLVRWHFQVVASTDTSDVNPIDTDEIHEAMFTSAPPKIPDPFLKRWTIEMLRSLGLA